MSRTDSRSTLPDEELSIEDQIIMFGSKSTATNDLRTQRNHLKELGLKRLTSREHTLVSFSRDVSLLILCNDLRVLWAKWYTMLRDASTDHYMMDNITSVKPTEFFLAGIWCLVTTFLSYSVLDGLMARWIVMYSVQAVIVRVLSMSLFIVSLVEFINYMFNTKDNQYCLPAWIIISCIMTLTYIIQNFVVSNLTLEQHLLNKNGHELSLGSSDETGGGTINGSVNGDLNSDLCGGVRAIDLTLGEPIEFTPPRNSITSLAGNANGDKNSKRKGKHSVRRTVDLYNITVFAVVPIGVASFCTMVGLIRLLIIVRLEIDLELDKLLPPPLPA
ncbi:unnamed protein product [Ambrosiozyma monospora]|uniref:Unnamed protein product n=1 Tax=Ambrosiozyma monospora TaxID=43982 RepID=A0A9W6YWE6_AMBMO|nr:unnamed protein product [Ambrosiozyma monospora]